MMFAYLQVIKLSRDQPEQNEDCRPGYSQAKYQRRAFSGVIPEAWLLA